MDNKERSTAIIKWLSEHPLISRNALCAMVGYDTSNLDKAFDGKRVIPERYLQEFEDILSNYGYNKL